MACEGLGGSSGVKSIFSTWETTAPGYPPRIDMAQESAVDTRATVYLADGTRCGCKADLRDAEEDGGLYEFYDCIPVSCDQSDYIVGRYQRIDSGAMEFCSHYVLTCAEYL